jgi:signal transduction histidine kinase
MLELAGRLAETGIASLRDSWHARAVPAPRQLRGRPGAGNRRATDDAQDVPSGSRSAIDAVRRILRITTTSLVPIALGLGVGPALADGTRYPHPTAAAAVLLVVGVAVVVLAVGSPAGPPFIVAATASFAMVLSVSAAPGDLSAALPTATSAAAAVSIVAGLLLPRLPALLVAAGVGGATAAVLERTARLVPPASREHALASLAETVVLALCDVVAATLIRGILLRAAHDADMSAEAALEATDLAARTVATRLESARVGRLLHDGVMNTLTVIAAGAPGSTVEAVRRRCREDAQVLREMDDSRSVESVAVSAPAGLTVSYADEGGQALQWAPAPVAAALVAATDELLRNVARHAGVTCAEVRMSGGSDGVTVVVRDEGVGFDASAPAGGSGLGLSVISRCAEVGATVDIQSVRGSGTTVTMRWQRTAGGMVGAPPATRTTATSQAMWTGMRPLGLRLASTLIVLYSLLTVITVRSAAGWPSVLAVAVDVGLVFAARAVALPQTLTSPVVAEHARRAVSVVCVLVIPVLVWLPGSWLTGPDRIGAAWWGTTATLVPIALLSFLIDVRVARHLAFVAYLVGVLTLALHVRATDGSEAALQVVGVGVLDGAAAGTLVLIRRLMVRLSRQADADYDRAADLRAESASNEAVARVREMHRGRVTASTLALLDAIADGRASPQDAEVRQACAREESHLREVINLPTLAGPLAPMLLEALSVASERHVRLVIRGGESLDPPPESRAQEIGSILAAAVAASRSEDVVTISFFEQDHVRRAIIVRSGQVEDATTAFNGDAQTSGSAQQLHGEVFVELTWPPTPQAVAATR